MSWVESEMAGATFGDQRLTKRVKCLLERTVSQPTVSIPTACRGWNETLAAYRFFDNPKVTAHQVLSPHRRATRQRMAQHPVALCVQDTTELDYTGQTQTRGLGPITYKTRRGLYLHTTLAITPQRLCLGVLDALMWARSDESYGKRVDCEEKTIEEKESQRWIEGYRQVCALSESVGQTQLVYMADRESDIYELFIEGVAQNHRADWLIRATHDRVLSDNDNISEALAQTPVLAEVEFDVPPTEKRSGRRVKQNIKAARVELRAPPRAFERLDNVEVTAVLAQEVRPPKGEEPVTWVLLTNLPVETTEQAMEKIEWYLCRWQIEVYFRVLKSGCKVEQLQLETTERLQPALALYMIVAWRVLFLTMLGRQCPELPCDLVFATQEWNAIYIVSLRKSPPPEPPALNTIVRLMAGFGGFLGRKHDGEPGPQSLWIGLQRTRDFALALEANRELQAAPSYV